MLGALAAGVGGALAGKLLGGGSQQSGTYTQTTEPWKAQQPYLTDLFGRAQTQSQTGISPLTNQYLSMTQDRATTGNPLNSLAQSNAAATLNGSYLTPDSNPFLQSTVNQALGDVKSQINSQFSGDNFGSSAHQEWLQRGLANTALPYYMQNYQQERQRQMGAQALAPTLANQDYTDINQLGQAALYQQNFPWEQLQKYQQAISGNYGGTQTSPIFTNPAANMAGGALAGLGLYGMMGQSGLFGGGGGLSSLPEMTGAGDLSFAGMA